MCQEFYEIFNELVSIKDNNRSKREFSFSGLIFILKYKFLKIFRDVLYIKIKNIIYLIFKKGIKNG